MLLFEQEASKKTAEAVENTANEYYSDEDTDWNETGSNTSGSSRKRKGTFKGGHFKKFKRTAGSARGGSRYNFIHLKCL